MALIDVQSLYKSFSRGDKDVNVLKGLDLKVEKGEILNILGASGAGKSTLLHILGTLDHPTDGRVLYNGEDIFLLKERDLASFRNRRIGFIFQFHHLLSEFTALENTMMPALVSGWPREKARTKAVEVLKRLGLGDRKDHKPGELSGGEQQRVAVSRAILLDPDVVLADEPTGNLDTKTGDEVHDLLLELNRELKITMIVVTHNLKLAKREGRRLLLVDGRIEET
ncbi:MAG: ABC transporter ATP-binding protein [Deltaproteobacteria bacterium]|uniref:ABC transporter ATP-binding protein n=1 Tax=Candidatus Zymogenus saltonus TaxID=2844893 RepID=A0A9D8KI99_9DELT|nr:ABC transporter ATP-binding protein [Candidatus Zymogenus saltonus]